MKLKEAKEFSQYVVYRIVNNVKENIAICKERNRAKEIAIMFALHDKQCNTYCFTDIDDAEPGVFVPGGGWVEYYQRNKETGKVEHSSLC